MAMKILIEIFFSHTRKIIELEDMMRKHSFSQRIINIWNKLSTDCVTATSLNVFKNKVDTYLRRPDYT